MKGNSAHKVENGKLIKVRLQSEQGKITEVKIFGDFFMHPEEAIDVLENKLQGSELDEIKLRERIGSILESNSVRVFGFKAKDLAKAIMKAVE